MRISNPSSAKTADLQRLQSDMEPDPMKLKHVVESQQFTVPLLMDLFTRARGMERVVARGGSLDYQNRIMATVFYAPSTRTRFSSCGRKRSALAVPGARRAISASSAGAPAPLPRNSSEALRIASAEPRASWKKYSRMVDIASLVIWFLLTRSDDTAGAADRIDGKIFDESPHRAWFRAHRFRRRHALRNRRDLTP